MVSIRDKVTEFRFEGGGGIDPILFYLVTEPPRSRCVCDCSCINSPFDAECFSISSALLALWILCVAHCKNTRQSLIHTVWFYLFLTLCFKLAESITIKTKGHISHFSLRNIYHLIMPQCSLVNKTVSFPLGDCVQ